jgi:transposase
MGAVRKEGKVLLDVRSTQNGGACPLCNEVSFRINGYYTRTILDLPLLGHETWIKLRARKFLCSNVKCERKVFCERLSEYFLSRKTVTNRVNEKLLKIGLLMGGNGGVRLCRLMNMPVSSSTLVRLIYQQPIAQPSTPKVIGIDDWAFKKGLLYGTVIVDLEKNRIIDLLSDREASSVENWLKDHPGVEVVSRDRYVNFANGIKQASASIIHVADRWHLIKNLGDAMQKVLDRNIASLKIIRDREIKRCQTVYNEMYQKSNESIKTEEGVLSRKFKRVKQLLSEGYSIRKIAIETRVQRDTIAKWKSFDLLPPKRSPKATNFYLYEEKVRCMLLENPKIETLEIWNKILKFGYNGSKTVAYDNIRSIIGKKVAEYIPRLPAKYWMASKASCLFYKDRNKLSKKELELVEGLCQESAEIKNAAIIIKGFRMMMETKNGSMLKSWIEQALASGIKELIGFAKGIVQDEFAVKWDRAIME